ncbi:cytochrome P450 6k1-like [Aricia agestis]|uniref:cytochrome P450 6k1-like n=1 Tax=Aricia agestis TaxID=91739 RepID=UPI001C202F9F|nr:cytochrome P450 6k1-like [Aricia agestis]
MWDYIFSTLLWLCVCTVILLGVYVHQTYKYWKKRGVEFDQPYFPLGNLNFLMRKSFWDYCMHLKERFPRDYVGIYLGLKPALVVQTPELARVVLTKDFEYFNNRYLYSNQSDPLGALNLFTVNNPIWRDVRHELSPMFTGHRLKLVTELMNQNSKELAKKIQRDFVEKKKNVNLKELFSMYTSDTVAYTVFGIRVSILNDQPSPLWFITSNMVHFTFWRGLEFTLVFLMPALAAFLRLKFFSEAATDFIKKMFWSVVDERKDVRNPNDKDLVNHLLQLKENLKLPVHDHSDPEMADKLMLAQAAVFILGSVETSSTTLSYLMHELAHHPEEQETLYEEIRQTLAKTGGDVLQYQELMEMKYLSACIYETLRKYPPVSYLDRKCDRTFTLNDDLTIEAGTPVFLNLLAIHYNENIYPEPKRWNPERFRNVADGDNLNYTFLPFGEGPRFCIGKRYGMMQVRAALAKIVEKFRIEPGEPYEVPTDPYSVMLSPKGGGTVKFVPR